MSALDEILKVFAAEKVNLKDVPEEDPIAAIGRKCEALFTGGVDALRSIIPNERIRALARVVWDLVGHKRVLVVLGTEIPTLSFTVMRHGGVDQGIVMLPRNWPQMSAEDPFMQLGAILFVGAQVVDFYNKRLIGDPSARARWGAYEAELLFTLAQILPGWKPNAYQLEVLARYPEGLDTKGIELYTVPPYQPAQENA
jgi:hypothetical protein